MIFCEECRVKRKLNLPTEFPFHAHEYAQCPSCKKYRDCYVTPGIFAKPDNEKTTEEKMIDKEIQNEYRTRSEELVICFSQGRMAGQIDHKASEGLKAVVVTKGAEVDWFATYQLRLRIQEGYKLNEERKSRRLL
jgi:hypothetical protein